VRKGRSLSITYGIKLWCYWEHIGDQKKTDPLSPPPQKKNIGPYSVYVEPSHWLHEIFISKTVCHHFSLGLMESMGTVYVLSSNIAWKKNPSFPTPPHTRKKGRPFHSMAQPLITCMEILILKLATTIFGLD